MKHNKKREYEQAPLGFVWVEGGEERGRLFRLEKCGKKHKAFPTEEEMNREKMKEGGGKVAMTNHRGLHGSFPGGEELLKGCWEAIGWAVLVQHCRQRLQEWLDFGNGGIQQRESLCADLELPHLLLPSAIIHGRRTPCEADDGCLACGPLTLAAVRDSCKKWEIGNSQWLFYSWTWQKMGML